MARGLVLLSDCKKGDVIRFRLTHHYREGHPWDKRTQATGKITSINQSRETLLVTFTGVLEDGRLYPKYKTYLKPAEVVGFHISGTPF